MPPELYAAYVLRVPAGPNDISPKADMQVGVAGWVMASATAAVVVVVVVAVVVVACC
jgi:hypothetical protein